MKKEPFQISPGFAEIDLRLQNDLLVDLIRNQEQVIKQQVKQIEELHIVVRKQTVEIEQLKSEVRRLKKLKQKPKIRPSKMNKDDNNPDKGGSNGGKRAGSEKRSKRGAIVIHQMNIIKVENVPEGSKFKGYQEYLVQGLEIKAENQLFKLERWQLPDGSYKVAQLPEGIKGHHFSPALRTYILYQHHHQGVTQPLLLSQLHEWGIDISSGQLNRILTEDKDTFHLEKKEILTAGLAVSSYIQADDTGARHNGKNGYCTHIGNELFAWFESTGSKSRLNFLNLLRQGHTDYIINEHALSYMKKHELAPKYRAKLKEGINIFSTEAVWIEHMKKLGITGKYQQRIATEGALIGALLHHGFRMDLAILSDDAGQFNLFQHALCWIHAERKINELIPSHDLQSQAIEEARDEFWAIYNDLKVYKKEPTLTAKNQIEQRFDVFVKKKTDYITLNLVLKRMKLNKKELLLVLERPEIPLHNNLSENDIREYVKKRKISGSTRSDAGRQCRDTFTSLKKTCKKLGVQFWDYLIDRISGKNQIPSLGTLITQKAAPA
jgi:hypothetical protein